jgi:hypothetical protein
MRYFSTILSQFTTQQRLLVLLILLVFTSGTYLISTFMKKDDCKNLIDENIELQNDLVTISRMVRELRKVELNTVNYVTRDTVFVSQTPPTILEFYEEEVDEVNEEIPNIEEFDKTTKKILDIIDGEGFHR